MAKIKIDSSLANVITGNVTSLQENNSNVADFKLYPNPANDFIYISGIHKGSTISIFNEAGRLSIKTIARSETCSLHINQLPQGLYYLSIEEKSLGVLKQQKITTIKFIKE